MDNSMNAKKTAETTSEKTGKINEGIDKEVKSVVEDVEKVITEIDQEEKLNETEQKEAMEEMYDKTFTEISEGAVIEGEVVSVTSEGAFVSVGYKNDAFIPKDQLSYRTFENPEEVVKVGEKVSVYVMSMEDEDGKLILSKKRADLEDA
ncbi:MAG: S1 RNA-binding domain-containing protein, partial [Candidatus Eremiobacterota bacterium]